MANTVRIASMARLAILLLAPALLALAVGWSLRGLAWGVPALAVTVVLQLTLLWASDRLALALLRAHGAPPSVLTRVQPLLEDLARRAGVPVPQICVIEDVSASACAIGSRPRRAAIVVTSGLLAHLADRELRAVLAAELAQIARRDLPPAVFAAALAGVILLPVTLLRWGRPFRWDDADRLRGSSWVYAALLLLAPLAMLVTLTGGAGVAAYDTDAMAARLCGEPQALVRALRRIARIDWLHAPTVAFAVAPLCIVHPFGAVRLLDLLDPRPPLDQRIRRLEGLSDNAAEAAR